MKNHFITTMVLCALALAVLGMRQKVAAQGGRSEPTNRTETAINGPATSNPKDADNLPPFITEIPAGYRDWKLISVAREEGTLDDIRAILGNDLAIKAYRERKRPFPEGAIIARLAWSFLPSEENNKSFGNKQSFVAGPPKNGVQFMIKDSDKYAATGGWGYGQFDNGKPASTSMLQSCFPCHKAIEAQDFIFTHYAP